MEESLIEAFLEEAICAPAGLPPGMLSVAKMAFGAVNSDGSGSNTSSTTPDGHTRSNSGKNNRTQQLQLEEARFYESLVNRISAALANEIDGRTLSRNRREEFAEQVVNHLAESDSAVPTRDITMQLLQGSDEEIVDAIHELADERNLLV